MESKKVVKAVKKGASQEQKAPTKQVVKATPKAPAKAPEIKGQRKPAAVQKAEAISGQRGHGMALKIGSPIYALANSAQVATSKPPRFYSKREIDDIKRARGILNRYDKAVKAVGSKK